MPNPTPLRPIVQKMFDSVADLADSVCIGAVDRSTLSTDELREYIFGRYSRSRSAEDRIQSVGHGRQRRSALGAERIARLMLAE